MCPGGKLSFIDRRKKRVLPSIEAVSQTNRPTENMNQDQDINFQAPQADGKNESLALMTSATPPRGPSRVSKVLQTVMKVAGCLALIIHFGRLWMLHHYAPDSGIHKGMIDADSGSVCVNPVKLRPGLSWDSAEDFKESPYRDHSLRVFQGAIRIPTESNEEYDSPEKDSRWEVFNKLHDYLEDTFPLSHKAMEKEVVNNYGLVYTWKGSDSSKKPIVLMAHQDVVPVLPETKEQWTYDPYSAHFDGKFIWGRGTGDDKHALISIFEAIELLLKDDFEPSRTVILSFGYDEESSGQYGAKFNAAHLEQKLGSNSVHAIIDEGGLGVSRVKGMDSAVVAVGEKGRYAGEVTLYTHGGHSSAPPAHTGIGIMAQVLNLIEDTPHEPLLTERNPFLQTIQCVAVHSETLDDRTRGMLMRVGKDKKITKAVLDKLSENALLKYNFQTSQAIDIVNGGLKINALPEKVVARIDNRIAPESSPLEVEQKLVSNVRKVAKEHGLGLVVNGKTEIESSDGQYFDYTQYSLSLDPAPNSPTVGSEAWDQFAGSVRYVYEDMGGPLLDTDNLEFVEPGNNVVVTPSIMTGNTDTRFYWNLTDNIYRFTPIRIEDDPKIHTVDEHISLENHLEGVLFYHAYIQNVQ